MSYNQARVRRLNQAKAASGDYVLYWMQAARRLERNHALDYALACARELSRPLVVYEALRADYPWASRRLHRFVLEGMRDNLARAAALELSYWPFVETRPGEGRGLVRRLAERAALVVTDDFPSFVVPAQSEGLARRAQVPVFAVDSNSIVPLARLGPAVSAAAHLRPRLHKELAQAWGHRAAARPRFGAAGARLRAPFDTWSASDLGAFVDALPIDASVPPVAATAGGRAAGRARLRAFVKRRLRGYAEGRSEPRSPEEGHASGLSPYLHFGQLAVQEVAEAVLATTGAWDPEDLRLHNRGKREGFFCDDPDVNAFLDEALTWRDLGYPLAAGTRRRRVTAGDGAARLGARDARSSRGRSRGRGSTRRPSSRTAAPTTRSGTRPSGSWWPRARSTTTCACCGARRCSSGRRRRPRPTARSSTSTTSTRSTGATPIPTRASSGASGSSTAPGGPSARCWAASATCRPRTPTRKFDLRPYLAYVERLPAIAAVRSGRVT